MRDKQRFEIIETDFRPGDTLLVFTDGIPEQVNASGEPWGYDNFMQVFKELSGNPDLETFVNGFLDRALQYAGGAVREDDMALLSIRYL